MPSFAPFKTAQRQGQLQTARICHLDSQQPSPYTSILSLQRAAGNYAVSRSLQPSSTYVPHTVQSVLNGSSGKPLDPVFRTEMEAKFGEDFSGVRIHTDSRAAKSAQSVNALAYTVGRDIVFGAAQYAPSSLAGQKLLLTVA